MLWLVLPGANLFRVSNGRTRAFLALAVLLAALLLPAVSRAAMPVIVPGREAEILDLFHPHELGSELAPGWSLHSFSIEEGTIHVWAEGPGEGEPKAAAYLHLTLDHPEYGPEGAEALPGFSLAVVEEPKGSEAALAELRRAVQVNDDGEFWSVDPVFADTEDDVLRGSRAERALKWLKDGLLLGALLAALLLALTAHKIWDSPRWVKAAVLGALVGGVGLRLWLSPAVALAPWSYSRILVSARLVYEAQSTALLAGGPVWMSETILDSTLALACLAPLAVYVHARYLLDDHRAAVVAAVIVAVLPLHLRFSHSDAAFIPSITVSSVVFSLVHAATRETSKAWAWVALALIAFPLGLMYLVRPLNIMYFPLLLATAFIDGGLREDKPPVDRLRAGLAFSIICLVTFGLGVPALLDAYSYEVGEGLSLDTLLGAAEVLFSPRMNALLNPEFSPPGLTLLAGLGAYDLWRRGRKRLGAFLVLWLLGFLVAHAYVVPVEAYMQARYHLHLVVPYMLLAACGFEAALTWLGKWRDSDEALWGGLTISAGRARGLTIALVAYGLASPLIHMHFVRNTDFNDGEEWLFVHSLRESMPAQCTVLEYTGRSAGSRFNRVGLYREKGAEHSRWVNVEIPYLEEEIGAEGVQALPEEVRAMLAAPPDCLYWYAGLPCWGNKPEGSHRAPVCDFVEGLLPMDEVASLERASKQYDGNLSEGLEQGTSIRFVLSRVRSEER